MIVVVCRRRRSRTIIVRRRMMHVIVIVMCRWCYGYVMVAGTTIGIESVRTRTEELVAVGIVGVNTEVPAVVRPHHRTIEVGNSHIAVVLPAVEHVAQAVVTIYPAAAEDVGVGYQTHHIVKIDFIHCLVLTGVEIQLVSHLIGQEQGLGAGLGV